MEATRNQAKHTLPFACAMLLWATLYWGPLNTWVNGWLHPSEDTLQSLMALGFLVLLGYTAPQRLFQSTQPNHTLWLTILFLMVLMGAVAQVLHLTFLGELAAIGTLWPIIALFLPVVPSGYAMGFSMFLVQAVPWVIINPLTVPLKVIATQLAVGLAQGLGWSVTATQNLIQVKHLALQVAAPCSGLNSIVGFSVMALLVGFLYRWSFVRLCLTLPAVWLMAIVLNALRIFMTIAWALWINAGSAFYAHDVLGYGVFLLGLGLLLRTGRFQTRHDT